jgi:LPXTG-motif cell wall-anchored protein
MGITMSNALALMRPHSYRFFHNTLGFDDFTWLLIGIVIVLLVVLLLRQRRRRWF